MNNRLFIKRKQFLLFGHNELFVQDGFSFRAYPSIETASLRKDRLIYPSVNTAEYTCLR
jgi:hypothetical protein